LHEATDGVGGYSSEHSLRKVPRSQILDAARTSRHAGAAALRRELHERVVGSCICCPVSNRRPRSACWIAWPGPPTRSGRFAPYPRRRVPAMTGKCSNRRQSALLRVAGRPRTRTALVRTALGSRPRRRPNEWVETDSWNNEQFHCSITRVGIFGTHNDRLQAAFHRYAGSSQATCRILRLQSRSSWTDASWLLQDPLRA